MTYGFKSRLAHQNGASDKACSAFFYLFFRAAGRICAARPWPEMPPLPLGFGFILSLRGGFGAGKQGLSECKTGGIWILRGVPNSACLFLCGKCGFCGKPALQALLKLREDFRRVCIRLYLGHHRLDSALLVDEEGRAHDAHRGLAVHLLFLPDAVRLNGGQLRV